jgi:signal transduction histidine kinase/CheY-like chemotaxis protein
LQEAFDTLEQRVQNRTRELSEVNRRLRNEIDLRNRIERALRDAKAEAETANLSKTRFLAAASHDLLQPLNAARLFTSALGQGENLDGKTSRAIERIDSSLRAAEELLTALLDISKLDAGALEPHPVVFHVNDVLATLDIEFGAIAREHGLELTTVPCTLAVRSDRQFLRRILQNFLSNALRYTRTGKVLLGCRRRGDRLSIQVWDTGPGIADEHLDEIFEEFRRLQPRDERGAKGMGLGLAIVQRMARALGHEVLVRSRPGHGSMFAVEVPIAATAPVALRAPARPRTAASLDRAVVLCVDNESSILEGMTQLLGGWTCHVLTAEDTDSALATLEVAGRAPDLVLADYHLDGDDTGLRTLEAVRARWGDVPGAIITADYGEEVRERVRASGVLILRKPIKPAALRAIMSQLLARGRHTAASSDAGALRA